MSESPTVEQPIAARCAAHPSVETYLRCGRCETPICPRCMVMTPVGARCRSCARLKRLPVFDVRPRDLARGLAGGLAAAIAGSVLLAFIPMRGFFGLLLIVALGYAVGEATTAVANRKRGNALAVAAAGSVLVGLVLGRALLLTLTTASLQAALLLAVRSLLDPLTLLGTLAAMAIAFSRVR